MGNEQRVINMKEKETKRKLAVARREQAILQAGMEIFSQKGFAAATIPDIARAAGVAVGTIYIYYPNKRELFIAVIRNYILNTSLLDLLKKVPEANIATTLTNILINRLDLIENNQTSRIFSLMGEIMRDVELKELWKEQFLRPMMSMMEGIFEAAADNGIYRRMETAVATRAIGGLILGFLILKSMEGDNSPLNRLPQEKVADELKNFILHGVLNDAQKVGTRKEDNP